MTTRDDDTHEQAQDELGDLAHLVCSLGEGVSTWRLAAGLLRRPAVLLRGALAVRRLPTLTLDLDDAVEDHAARRRLLARRWLVPTGSYAVAVQRVPQAGADPLAGPDRRAWRRKVATAERAGIACHRVLDPEQQRCNLAELIRRRGWADDTLASIDREHGVRPGRGFHFVAVGPEGDVLSVCLVTRDGSAAFLDWHESEHSRNGGLARYALAHAVLLWLAQDGATWFVAGSVLGLPAGLRYYQKRLGFELYTIAARFSGPAPRPDGEPRVPGRTITATRSG